MRFREMGNIQPEYQGQITFFLALEKTGGEEVFQKVKNLD